MLDTQRSYERGWGRSDASVYEERRWLPATSFYMEGWELSFARYVGDHALFVVALLCLILTSSRFQYKSLRRIVTEVIVWQVASCLMFGFAQHLTDRLYGAGRSMITPWYGNTPNWVYPWLAGMVLAPVGISAFVALVLTGMKGANAHYIAIVAYVIGCSTAVYEASTLVVESVADTASSATVLCSMLTVLAFALMMVAWLFCASLMR